MSCVVYLFNATYFSNAVMPHLRGHFLWRPSKLRRKPGKVKWHSLHTVEPRLGPPLAPALSLYARYPDLRVPWEGRGPCLDRAELLKTLLTVSRPLLWAEIQHWAGAEGRWQGNKFGVAIKVVTITTPVICILLTSFWNAWHRTYLPCIILRRSSAIGNIIVLNSTWKNFRSN